MTVTKPQLQGMLQALGDTPQQVRDTLFGLEIKGQRFKTAACPVANFVRLHLPDIDRVKVSIREVAVVEHDDALYEVTRTYTPDQVSAFMRAFDKGDYPELDQEPDADR